jgi:hypothetical protein
MKNPIAVVMNVCHALSRIGHRHCQPAAKTAEGAGSKNCSMSNRRTTISHIANSRMITTHGRTRRCTFRRNRNGLRRLRGGSSTKPLAVTSISCFMTRPIAPS